MPIALGVRRPAQQAAEKLCRSPSTVLRTNGVIFDIIENFPFMLRHSKHSDPFFSAACWAISASRIRVEE